jgi:hypothetical protein
VQESGPGRAAGRAEREGKERRKKAVGWAVQREREKWAGPTGLCGRGRKRPARAGPQGEKKIGKRNRESGPGPIRKRERKRNAFKWKTINKTMQWGMKCTKLIVPYISFYGLLNCCYFTVNALKPK